MDKFVKLITVIAVAGSAACAIKGFITNDDKKPTSDRQAYEMNAKWAEVPEEQQSFIYGSCWDHLEEEKEFLALADSETTYTATIYYCGDHYKDQRIMVVTSDVTGKAVQVMSLYSYEMINKLVTEEVPD